MRIICHWCRRPVHQQRNGEWYHDHTASVFCHPGDGIGRVAMPVWAGTGERA
jgi:hypothetical protein